MIKKIASILTLFTSVTLGFCHVAEIYAADGITGIKNFNGHYYALFNDSMYWTQAKAMCEQMGGHLVTVTSQEEQDFIKNLADEQGTKYYFWLGGTDAVQEGTWKWVTDEEWDYECWDDGQPNDDKSHDSQHGQDYLLAEHIPNTSYNDMKWDDQPNDGVSGSSKWYNEPYNCRTEYYGFICEWENYGDIKALNIANGTMKLSQTKYTYNGDEFQPGVTVTYNGQKLKKGSDYTVMYQNNIKIGRGTVTVRGIGNYSGSISKSFTINPGKVKSFTAKVSSKQKVLLSWKKVAKASGYQFQYSSVKNFRSKSIRTIAKGSARKTTVSSLQRGKTWYFRIRSYTKSSGKTYYGNWSAIKQVRIKK